jgi:hypothetical protein
MSEWKLVNRRNPLGEEFWFAVEHVNCACVPMWVSFGCVRCDTLIPNDLRKKRDFLNRLMKL